MSSILLAVEEEVRLAALAEVAKFLGLSRNRVQELARREDFPKPIGYLGIRRLRVWNLADIEEWARKDGRL